MKAGFAAQVPSGRMGTAEEVVSVVAFLSSKQSSFVLGTTIYIAAAISSPDQPVAAHRRSVDRASEQRRDRRPS